MFTTDLSSKRSWTHEGPAAPFTLPPGFFSFLVAVLSSPALAAHDPGLSSMELRLDGSTLRGTLTLARADLEALGREAGALPDLETVGMEALAVRCGDRGAARVAAEALEGPGGSVSFRLSFREVSGPRLSLRSNLLPRLPRGHRQWISVTDGQGRTICQLLLDASAPGIEIDVPGAAAAQAPGERRAPWAFFLLGVEHIGTGYDHLAFLLCVLAACRGLPEAAKIITSFSAAHSLTLALCTLGFISVSPRLVEPLIAASIAYVGLENLLRRDSRRRWLLTFGFGLVHGLGFASVLREMGVGSAGEGAAAPLIHFNLGVEAGQLAIALLASPILLALRSHPQLFARSVKAFSAAAAVLAVVLLVGRLV